MAIKQNLPVDDYLGIELPDDPQDTATPKSRAADDYLGLEALGGQRNAPASQARQASASEHDDRHPRDGGTCRSEIG